METVTAVPGGNDVTLEVDCDPGSFVLTAGHAFGTSEVTAWQMLPADVDQDGAPGRWSLLVHDSGGSNATAALRAFCVAP